MLVKPLFIYQSNVDSTACGACVRTEFAFHACFSSTVNHVVFNGSAPSAGGCTTKTRICQMLRKLQTSEGLV